jgi:acetyl esterase
VPIARTAAAQRRLPVDSPMTSRLDPQAQDLLDVIGAVGLAPIHTLPVADARERMRATLISATEPLALTGVEDVSLATPSGALRLRLYRPCAGTLPIALFFHGGGWTLNDVDTHDDLCRRLAKRSGWLFASLDYRRAPEHKHPAALEDAYQAYRWLLDNAGSIGCDPTRRAVVGESSGGTIAASLTLLLRDSGAPLPTYQILAYPLMDALDRWPSRTERGSGYTLDSEQVKWFLGHCLPENCDPADPYLFPLASQDLSGLPPALVMTAEFDPLRDEGVAYAEKLARAGVSVEHLHADDQMHGFLMLSRAVARASQLVDHLADALASHRAGNRTAGSRP